MQTGEIEKLFHQPREPFRLPDDDLHAFLSGIRVGPLLQSLGPAFDGGEGRAQFVGNGRDKVVFHLFGGAQFAGHVVDGVAQVADLVVFGFVDTHGKITLGNLPGALAQLPHWHQDGPDKVSAGQSEQQHDEYPRRYQDEND